METSELEAPLHRPLIERAIAGETLRALGLPPPITVPQEATLLTVLETLKERHIGCVLVTGGQGRLVGIFTERDLMTRVPLRSPGWADECVQGYMTPEPEALRPDDSIAWALKLMHVGGYRHVPLTDEEGRPVGVVSIKDIVDYIVDLFPAPVLNLPPDPRQKPDSEFMGGGED